MPARLAIFVAQLGRKFRLFSLTMQRYEIFRSPPNFFAKKARKKARTLKLQILLDTVYSYTVLKRAPSLKAIDSLLLLYNNKKYNCY